ncbi:MAG: hypothetical protein ACKO26_04025 [Planctomycetota bacterium]
MAPLPHIIAQFLVHLLVTSDLQEDPLKDAKARLAVELARIEYDFRDGLKEADKLLSKSPQKSKAIYEQLKKTLENEQHLPDKRKTYLIDICSRKIIICNNMIEVGIKELKSDSNALQRNQKKYGEDFTNSETELSVKIKEIRELQVNGRIADATKKAIEIYKRYPDNPAIQASIQMLGIKNQVAYNNEFKSKYESGYLVAMRQIEESGIPITGDLVFPPDWAEKSKRRSSTSKLTEKEKSLLKSLSTPMDINIEGKSLEYFLQEMENKLGVSLIVDRPAVEAAGVRIDSPVTVKARNWTGRTVLKKVLADLGLSYIIRSEEIQVTTAERSRENLVTRSYYIGDLLGVSNMRLPPWYNQQQFAQTLTSIIDSIKSQVDPRSWQPEGSGSIVFEPLSMSLIIRQTAEVHFLLGSNLK